MRWSGVSVSVLSSSLFVALAASVAIGPISEKKPPAPEEVVEPESDIGIDRVGLRATVTGEVGEHGKANLYVFVNPLSNPSTRDTWWVQEGVTVQGDEFSCSSQFGENSQGAGEYFAIVALATDKTFDVGQQVHGLSKADGYTKLKIVKRNP